MFPFAYDINPSGWIHLMYFGVAIPIMVIRARMKLRRNQGPLPDRLRHFKATAFTLIAFAIMSLFVARFGGIELFPLKVPPVKAILGGWVMLAAAVAVMRPRWRRAVKNRTPLGARVLHLFMPANAGERTWWVIVAVLAGISEEITWRGVQTALLANLTGSFWIAAIICSISFAFGHFNQGWRSSAIIFVFAVSFSTLVWLSGSLYVAMFVHITYDLIAGITYGRLGKEFGYSPTFGEPAG